MSGLSKFVELVKSGDMSFRDTAIIDEVNGVVIDTVNSPDAGWETGIKKPKSEWEIVENYESKEEAEKGHKKWVKVMMKDSEKDLDALNDVSFKKWLS